jgi:predicted  nucleic acid-binding Zn-ribbon protein
MIDQLQKRVEKYEQQLKDVEVGKEELKNQISGLEREIESYKRLVDVDKKNFEDLMRERDVSTIVVSTDNSRGY